MSAARALGYVDDRSSVPSPAARSSRTMIPSPQRSIHVHDSAPYAQASSTQLSTTTSGSTRIFDKFVGGCASGFVGVFVGHPLDTLKVRLQTSVQRGSALDVFRRTVQHEGVAGLYAGVLSPLSGVPWLSSIQFGMWNVCQKLLAANQQQPGAVCPVWKVALAGSCGVLASEPLAVPFDLVKIQMQSAKPGTYRHLGHCLMVVLRHHGIRGLYRGTGASLIRDMPANFLYFGGYELLKRQCLDRGYCTSHMTAAIVAGIISGTNATLFSHPIDVVKSRIQSDLQGAKYRTFLQTARLLYSEHGGVKGLFPGFGPNVVRAGPSAAVTFLVYESVIHWMQARASSDPQ